MLKILPDTLKHVFRKDFEALCGRFIHHQPTLEKGDETGSKNTLAAFQKIFGSVHPVWLSSEGGVIDVE